jgi:hypothetical protein
VFPVEAQATEAAPIRTARWVLPLVLEGDAIYPSELRELFVSVEVRVPLGPRDYVPPIELRVN